MSVTRTPRLADIRRREDEADRNKVVVIVGGLCVAAAFLVVGLATLGVFR